SSGEELTSDEELSSKKELSDDIASSKVPSKHLLKWYDDSTKEIIPDLKFSKSTTSNDKASKSTVSKSKALSSKPKASALKDSKSKALTSSASMPKASTSKTLKVSTSKPFTSSGYRKIAMPGCVLFLRAPDTPIEQFRFLRATNVADVGSCSRKRSPK
ncbi:hypothetical protein Tco_0783703, partial [Tanacetum coccineum]